MKSTKILNTKQMSEKLGITPAYLNRLTKEGCPYHQLVPEGRKYYLLPEVMKWISTR